MASLACTTFRTLVVNEINKKLAVADENEIAFVR
jgi:hypothetical protein